MAAVAASVVYNVREPKAHAVTEADYANDDEQGDEVFPAVEHPTDIRSVGSVGIEPTTKGL